MNTTRDYVLLAVALPLALWFISRPSGLQKSTWSQGTGIKVASWIVFLALLYWLVSQILWPMFF